MDNHRDGDPGQEGQTAPDTDAFVRAVTSRGKDAPPGSPLYGIPATAVPGAAAVVAPPETRDPDPPAEATAEPRAAAVAGDDEAKLLRAMQAHGWHMLLLAPRSKEPPHGKAWQTTTDAEVVRTHLRAGGNVGLICGSESGVMVLDFDDHEAAMEMIRELGPLPPMVKGRKGFHVYVRHLPDMPAKIMWGTKLVGELQRGPRQYVVCPPSIHPETGKAYTWVGDPVAERPELPAEWREHVADSAKPHVGWLPERPDHAELLRAALGQPGAHQSRKGVKFQCKACREQRGRDRHKDNAIVFHNGWWGCAWASQQGNEPEAEHRRAIGEAIGAPLDPFSTTESGDAEFFAARYGNRSPATTPASPTRRALRWPSTARGAEPRSTASPATTPS
jgi:hypothetical protein